MKLAMEILLFLMCLNIATTLIFRLGDLGAIPATTFTMQNGTTMTPEELEENFNGTQVGETWISNNQVLSPFNLYGVFNVLGMVGEILKTIQMLIIGFPTLLDWIKLTFIPAGDGQLAFNIIEAALIGIEGLLLVLWFVEFISGRETTS